jgi:hypothetical protein
MKYRKPRTINWVTFMLVGVAGLLVYLIIYLWPVYSVHSRVKGILLDHVPALYKANLMPDEVSRPMMEGIKNSIAAELNTVGVNDKAAKIFLRRNPKAKEIELEVRFKAKAHFPWPDKTFEFNLAPKVVSDATRVDW